MNETRFQQLSSFSDGPTAAEHQQLQARCEQAEHLLQALLTPAHQSIHAGKPAPLAAAILRTAAQHQHQGEATL